MPKKKTAPKGFPLNLPPTKDWPNVVDFMEAEHSAEVELLKKTHRAKVELLHHTIRHLLADLDLHEALNAAYRLRIDRIRNEVHEDRVANAILRPRMFIERTVKAGK
jgi:hypothetical protein